jgi:CheY-like chemotaxis protein
MRRTLTRTLETAYDVTAADHALEALTRAIYDRPAAMIIDTQLPGMPSGVLADCLRQNLLTALIPIIYVSADHSLDRLTQALANGAADFLAKPIAPGVLLPRLQRHLHQEFRPGTLVIVTNERTRISAPATIKTWDRGEGILECTSVVSFEEGDFGEIQATVDHVHNVRRAVVFSRIDGHVLEVQAATGLYNSPRRLQARRELDLPVRYRIPKSFFRVARLRNVSAGGIGLSDIETESETGSPIEIEMGKLYLTGVIRWLSPSKRDAGIQFGELSSDQQMILTKLMFSDQLLEAARNLMYGK